jgi:hypothetical protein
LDRAMQDANLRELHFWNCLINPKHEPNVGASHRDVKAWIEQRVRAILRPAVKARTSYWSS